MVYDYSKLFKQQHCNDGPTFSFLLLAAMVSKIQQVHVIKIFEQNMVKLTDMFHGMAEIRQ